MTFQVDVRPCVEQRYASVRERVKIDRLGSFIGESIETLRAAHGDEGPPFAIFHGQVDADLDGPVEVGVPCATGDRRLAAGEEAVTIARGAQRDFPAIVEAFDALATWARDNGRELAAPPREIYIDEDEWEVVWPLRS